MFTTNVRLEPSLIALVPLFCPSHLERFSILLPMVVKADHSLELYRAASHCPSKQFHTSTKTVMADREEKRFQGKELLGAHEERVRYKAYHY